MARKRNCPGGVCFRPPTIENPVVRTSPRRVWRRVWQDRVWQPLDFDFDFDLLNRSLALARLTAWLLAAGLKRRRERGGAEEEG